VSYYGRPYLQLVFAANKYLAALRVVEPYADPGDVERVRRGAELVGEGQRRPSCRLGGVRTAPGKSWNLIFKFSRPWKLLENVSLSPGKLLEFL
jgi:hypothetical protein